MSNSKKFITIQEAATMLGCSTRSVYRKIDAIDTFDNLVAKGFADKLYSTSGNISRLFSKDWLQSTFVNKEKKKTNDPIRSEAFEYLKGQLNLKDEQLEAAQDQINRLLDIVVMAQRRVNEVEKYYHLNKMDESPKLTTTKESLEKDPGSVLNYNSGVESEKTSEAAEGSNEIQKDDEKSISDWFKSFR